MNWTIETLRTFSSVAKMLFRGMEDDLILCYKQTPLIVEDQQKYLL